MTQSAPLNAPACFGAATVFSHDSDICRQCVAFNACADAAIDTLNAIRQIINIDDLLSRHNKAKKAAHQAIQRADQEREAAMPPGNITPPLSDKPVERRTPTVPVTIEVSSDNESILARLPVKPREIAIRLCKKGDLDQLRDDIAHGRNTFAQSGPGFLRVAIDMLLSGGFAKSELRKRLQEQLGWSEGTAMSHVGIACALLLAFKFAQESSGRFVLVPVIERNNAV